MAPKVNCNAQKLTSIQTWFRKSRTVWSLKELEKQLPAVGSINNMQVKDYIQTLQDDSKILCEKIGSGNWYWSFPSQHAKNVEAAHTAASAEHAKLSSAVSALRSQLSSRAAATQQEELDQSGESRQDLITRQQILHSDVEGMKKELASYSDSDPTELEKQKAEAWGDFSLADGFSEDIYAMESWFKKMGAEEMVASLKDTLYVDEWDHEEEMLRELSWRELC
ncbi:putative mnd1, HTH domain-containing protein [Septoria linicola]|nr:putative mnd1, HTH domain-containing protein [Septoria linicola]